MPAVSGTFAATGQSATLDVSGSSFTVSLDFAGTASVNVERSFDGSTWKVVKTYTGDAEENGLEPKDGVKYRLNCTAHTDNVVYVLATPDFIS